VKKSFFTVLIFAKLNTKRFFRDKTALFFAILFPVIFLFVFGGISNIGGDATFTVALLNQSDTKFAKEFEDNIRDDKIPDVKFKVDQESTTYAKANQKMLRGQVDAILILPKTFGETNQAGAPTGNVQVRYSQNNAQAGRTLDAVMQAIVGEINQQHVKADQPLKVDSQQTAEKGQNSFDYTFAGLLGFSIIGLGIFGPINVFPELKKQGILRRLHTTPLRVWQYFVSMSISQSIHGLVAIGILFVVAKLVFHLSIVGNIFEIVPFIVFSIIMILGIGLALGGWAKNERQVAPLSNIVVFPMMFLSGTFFPRFLMPEWLQHVSALLPLTSVIDGFRLLITEGQHLTDIGPQLGLMAGWTIIIYLIAFRVFRWE
jgi:ABC-2 type transport system permease protein